MARRPAPSDSELRARRLLRGGAIGGHVGAAVCVMAYFVACGPASALSAAVACAVTLAFNIIGHGVQVAFADAPPKRIMFAALASYVVRVSVLGVLLLVVLNNSDKFADLDATALVVGTITVVIAWLGAELWVYSRLRIPVFDPPETPDGA